MISCSKKEDTKLVDAFDIPPVKQTNNTPVSSNDSVLTRFNRVYNDSLQASDSDSDPLVYSLVTNASNGVVVITDSSSGSYTYTPNTGHVGADSFEFKVNDGTEDSNTSLVNIDVKNPETIYVGTSNGLSISTDGGLTFVNRLETLDVKDIQITESGDIYVGTNFDIYISTDGGSTFTSRYYGSDDFVSMYIDSSGAIFVATDWELLKSTNNGLSFNSLLSSSLLQSVDGDDSGNIYVSYELFGFSISTDGGSNFTNYSTANGLGSDDLFSSFVDTNGTIYASTFNGLSISTDGGSNFTNYTTVNGLGSDDLFSSFGIY